MFVDVETILCKCKFILLENMSALSLSCNS